MSIKIFYEEIDFRLNKPGKIRKYIKKVIESENKYLGDLTFIFTSDDRLLQINIEFLNHDYFTDVITFDYNEDDVINGEIYISIDSVRMNAVNYNVSLEKEVLRVMIHGVLHLLGYDDITGEGRAVMRREEDLWLKMIGG